MKQEVKKLLILNLPYLLFVYLFDKIGAAIPVSYTHLNTDGCPKKDAVKAVSGFL